MDVANKGDARPGCAETGFDAFPIPLLETIRRQGRVWEDLAAQYGVINPDPPWKIAMDATCDALSAEACALPLLERRQEEDELSVSLYADVPFPERQLLALAHSMMRRGLFTEEELAHRMKEVHERFTST